MEFFTTHKEKRPVRLCEATRIFAWESLNHRYGLDTCRTPYVTMDDVEGFEGLSDLDRYDLVIRRIAESSPLRVCVDEKVSGSATLGLAIEHKVPAKFNDRIQFSSISHLTVDFEKVLKYGMNGIESDVRASLRRHGEGRRRRFLESCLSSIESMRIWHARYLEVLKDKPEYCSNYRNLLRVPFEGASTFHEAVQSIWFCFSFLRLCGYWPGIGRIDWLLGPYLEKDLARGIITLDEAREILAHLFIKGCEWIKGGDYGSGDAQHYQNIVLSGVDADGNDVTNKVSYLVLDIIEELGISDFPVSIRLNSRTDRSYLERVAQVLKFGGGVLAFYNEELVMRSLRMFGYPEEDVWRFANDGCWEIQIPGKTFFTYVPFDSLAILQESIDGIDADDVTYDKIYSRFLEGLDLKVKSIAEERTGSFRPRAEGDCWEWKDDMPCTVVSLFERGCVEKGLSYKEGGPVYNVVSPHIGGFPDTVNSLYALRKLVFEDGLVGFDELRRILDGDWEGCEALRQTAMNRYSYYGNANREVDDFANDLLSDFADICSRYEGVSGYRFPPGVSTFGRQIAWAEKRNATPSGHKAHEVLAPNCSPTPGSDRNGATSIIRSYCCPALVRMGTGAALDLKILSSSVEGTDGTQAIVGLLRGFVKLGGCFIQPDIVDNGILLEAQRNPQDYQTLSVRVSGWNARFVTLDRQWQDMIINEGR